jgi:hypothetical protein
MGRGGRIFHHGNRTQLERVSSLLHSETFIQLISWRGHKCNWKTF